MGFCNQKEEGWVYVEQDADLPFVGGTVLAYAYETDPDVPILAMPEPRSIWLAAILPLTAMRRRRPEPRRSQVTWNG